GDVDREDLEGRSGVEATRKDVLRDVVGILEHVLVRLRRSNRAHHAFADARDDGFFAGAADEPIEVRADGDAGNRDQLDAVLGHGRDARRLDDLRQDRHLHGLKHVAAGQVDRGRALEGHVDVGLVGRDQRVDDAGDVTAGQIVRFELVDAQGQAGLYSADPRVDDDRRRHAPQPHADEREQPDVGARRPRRDPQRDRDEVQDEDQQQYGNCQQADGADGRKVEHHSPPDSVIRRTTMRLPSTRVTLTGAPASMKTPSETTSTRVPSISAMPAGRSGETARPVLPSHCRSVSGDETNPSSASMSVERMSLRPKGSFGRTRMATSPPARATTTEIATRPRAEMTAAAVAPLPTSVRPSPATSMTMPATPARVKPGRRKTSTSSSSTPTKTSSSSSHPASWTIQWPQKNRAIERTPIPPGTPKPGVRISTSRPSRPRVISSELTTGFVMNRTIDSAHVCSARKTSAPARPTASSVASSESAVESAVPWSLACDGV